MKFETIHGYLDGIPFMEPDRARTLYEFIIDNRISNVLELGFAHGVSSCYIAAALDELGAGSLTSVDLLAAKEWQEPCIEDLLAKTGLGKYVSVVREQTSYTWFLKKQIEKQSQGGQCRPLYDFCFIDGPKNWTIDGLSFFAADKLLKKGGWFLFDDFGWKYKDFPRDVMDGITIRTLGQDERETAQIELVFRLFVMQHPNYGHFKIQDNWWAWAQKVASPEERRSAERSGETARWNPKLLTRIRRRLQRASNGNSNHR